VATLTLSAFGLRPTRLLTGAAPTFQMNVYWISQTYATAIGFGDPVIRQSTGYIAPYTAGTSHVLGVFAGLQPYFDTTLQQVIGGKNWYSGHEVAGGPIACWVYDDPRQIFVAQVDTSNANNPITIANAGGNIDMVLPAPNSTTGISSAYLDASTWNVTTSTLPFRVLGPATNFYLGFDPTTNTPTSQPTNNYAEVVMNTSEYQTSTGI